MSIRTINVKPSLGPFGSAVEAIENEQCNNQVVTNNHPRCDLGNVLKAVIGRQIGGCIPALSRPNTFKCQDDTICQLKVYRGIIRSTTNFLEPLPRPRSTSRGV